MDQNPQSKQSAVFWVIWFAITAGLVMMNFLIFPRITGATTTPMLKYLPAIPLVISSFIRWNLLPGAKDPAKALTLFVIGLALAEGCGIQGILLVPEFRDTYFMLALLGLIQYAPTFAKRFES